MQVNIPKTDFIDFPQKSMPHNEKIETSKSHFKSTEKKSNVGNMQPLMKDGACFKSGYFEK